MAIERNPNWDANTASETDEQFASIAAATAAEHYSRAAKTAEQIFRESAADAAQEIVNLSLRAANERVRLDASKYVIDRVMGRITDARPGDNDNEAPWAGVYGTTVIREPNAAEREAGKSVSRTILQAHNPHAEDD